MFSVIGKFTMQKYFYSFGIHNSFFCLEKKDKKSLFSPCRANPVITVRNQVARVMFLQACVCPQGGWCLPQCMLGYHTLPPRADTPQEQTPPGSGPPGADTPPQSRHPPGADTPGSRHPPEIRSLLRTVRILLECILVYMVECGQTFTFARQNTGSKRSVLDFGPISQTTE